MTLLHQTLSKTLFRSGLSWPKIIFMSVLVILSLVMFGGFFLASFVLPDPTPISDTLEPLFLIFILFNSIYHFYLICQTICLGSNIVSDEFDRHKYLTKAEVHKIVRDAWRKTIQRQLPYYLLLGFLRAGGTIGASLGIISVFYPTSNYYDQQFRLLHALNIFIVCLIGVGFTIIGLGLSAACGVIVSGTGKDDFSRILRGVRNQIAISVLPAFAIGWLIGRIVEPRSDTTLIYTILASLGDNGMMAGIFSIGPIAYDNFKQNTLQQINPISVKLIIHQILAMTAYIPIIWFALWRAEKNVI